MRQNMDEIVKLHQSQIKSALELVLEVFSEFEAPDYSQEGIKTFKEFIQLDSILKKIEAGELCFWECCKEDQIVGVIATKGLNHICLLFVKKEFHRQGIARRLFRKVLDVCLASEVVKKITVNSSPYALEAYRRLGFQAINGEQSIDGLRFIPMEYLLE
jgi:GNAT superfamily N-acetyltransferase